MRPQIALGLALLTASLIGLQNGALAQNPTDNNQPVRGELHTRETVLKERLKTEFKAGRIDSTILAKMQRDLDAICVKEDELRSEKDGLTPNGHDDINKKLDIFESQLNQQVTKQ